MGYFPVRQVVEVERDTFPGGSDGQIQFNANGEFGGAAELAWDSGQKRLGVGLSNPQHPLDVAGAIHAHSPNEAAGTQIAGIQPLVTLDTGFRFTTNGALWGLFVRARTTTLVPGQNTPVQNVFVKRIA